MTDADRPQSRVDQLHHAHLINADRVAVSGDWHGNTRFATAMIDKVARETESDPVRWLLHLGDFGIWPGQSGKDYLDAVETALDEWDSRDIRILITPGNHENWGWLRPTFEDNSYRDPIRLRDHIAVLPPGFRFTVRTAETERVFLSLGGAPSIDYDRRIRGEEWWPEEEITDADMDRASTGGFADVMLAHDAPNGTTPVVEQIIRRPWGWAASALAYAARGRWRISLVYSDVLPIVYLHGHYHEYDEAVRLHREAGARRWSPTNPDGATRFVSLACDGMPGNTVILDIATLEPRPLDL